MSHLEQLWREFSEAVTDGVLDEHSSLTLYANGQVTLVQPTTEIEGEDQSYPFPNADACADWLSNARYDAHLIKSNLIPASLWPTPIPS